MAKVARKIKTKKGLRLKIVNPDAAGIDVSDGEMQVCVPEDRDGENNRRFGSFTCDLHEICAWLKACRITTVAMEATGVYWLNIFLILQDEGFDVVLAAPQLRHGEAQLPARQRCPPHPQPDAPPLNAHHRRRP